jgi:hypothetical protein
VVEGAEVSRGLEVEEEEVEGMGEGVGEVWLVTTVEIPVTVKKIPNSWI